jgi:hypothetical protein
MIQVPCGRRDMLQETIEPAWLDAFEAEAGRVIA